MRPPNATRLYPQLSFTSIHAYMPVWKCGRNPQRTRYLPAFVNVWLTLVGVKHGIGIAASRLVMSLITRGALTTGLPAQPANAASVVRFEVLMSSGSVPGL